MFAIFVRHGETPWNKLKKIQGRKDFPLNEIGREEAKKLSSFLKEEEPNIDFIISSPLIRAVETASIIKKNAYPDTELIIDNCFIERDFGPREGMDVSKEVFVDILSDKAEGVEKSYEIQKRVSEGLKKLYLKYPDSKVLIVSHSHTIKAITTHLEPDKYRFDDKLDNCSLTYIEVQSDFMRIKEFNVSKM